MTLPGIHSGHAATIDKGSSLIAIINALGLTSGLQGCYDFGDRNCYSGSGQTINDLSGQGNGLFLGTSAGDATFDPTFSGTVGGLSASELFQCGSKIIGGTQPAWMQTVHKDNGKISIAQWTRTTAGSYSMGGVVTAFNNTPAAAYPGWNFGVADGNGGSTLGRPIFAAYDNAGTTVGFFQGSAGVGTGSWMFSGCSIDEQAGTAVIQIDATQYTGAITYASPTASNSSNQLLLSPSGATAHDKSELALWNIGIGATSLNAVYNATKARFGL